MAEPAAADPAQGDPPAGDPPASPPANGDKTFTQDELNAIVQDRLARATKGQPSKDELTELRAAKTKLEELEQAGASELEKANKAREQAEAKATEALATANERLLKSTAITALVGAGVTSVEAAYRALDKTGLTVEDDGTVSGLDDAVKALVEEVPAFVGKGTPGSADQGARGGGPDQITREQLSKLTPREVQQGLREGKFDHLTQA